MHIDKKTGKIRFRKDLVKFDSVLYKYDYSYRKTPSGIVHHVYAPVFEENVRVGGFLISKTLAELKANTEVPTPVERALYG